MKHKLNQNYNSQSKLSLPELHKLNLNKIHNSIELLEYIYKTGDILVNYNNNKQHMKHQYLMLVDIDYRIKHSRNYKYLYCNNCNLPKLNIDGSLVCKECGETEYMIINHPLKKYTPYLKITYLKEKLRQFQAKESKPVPYNVISVINTEREKRIIPPDVCTIKDIQLIMKKYRFQKFYKNINQIYYDITNKPAISLSQQTDQKIIYMFKQMEPIYRKLFPNRKTFLSYSYLLNRLFNIINMPEIASRFSLLKSTIKLKEHDSIFNIICKHLNWKF